MDTIPKLRWPLETQRVVHENQKFLMLRDPLGIAEEAIFIPEPLVPIVSRFDGTRRVADIVEEGRAYGITRKLVEEILNFLSAKHFLDDPQFARRQQMLLQEFELAPLRPCVFGDSIYPNDLQQLEVAIQKLQNGVQVQLQAEHAAGLCAVASPHIDYARGGVTYGYTSVLLEQVQRPDVIVLLGTSHAPGLEKFILLRKGLATPFGPLPLSEMTQQIARRYGEERAYREQFLHRREHSLELQLPFLGHRYRRDAAPAVVPLLVGSFHDAVIAGREPIEFPEVEDFVEAAAEAVRQVQLNSQRIVFFAGVDLAHVGLHFGDSSPVAPDGLEALRARDMLLLEAVLESDEHKLFAHIAEDGDARRICGFPSLYTMFAVLRRAGLRTRGHLLDYRQAVNAQDDCVVTFASAYWANASRDSVASGFPSF